MQPANTTSPLDIMSPFSPPDTAAALNELITTYHQLNSRSADIHHGPPTPIQFLRYVHANHPVVFKGAATKDHFEPAKWNTKYLLKKMEGCNITIAETPFGYSSTSIFIEIIHLMFFSNADSAAINEADGKTYFVKPHETSMPFDEFVQHLHTQAGDGREKSSPVMYSQSRRHPFQLEFE